MKSEENMDAGEGLCDFMPTEDLVIVGRLPISVPLNGNDADTFVYYNTSRLGLRVTLVKGLVLCTTKLCDSMPFEGANGEPLEGIQLGNTNIIPVTHFKVVDEIFLTVKRTPQEYISKFA